MSILIIDSVMGSGKSNWAINRVKTTINPVMYVTPYLEEIERFKNAIPNLYVPFGQELGFGSQTDSLKRLLEMKVNIATTHSLFSLMTEEMLELIKLGNYSLVLDEVVDAYQTYPMTKQDYKLLKEKQYIFEDDTTKQIYANKDTETQYIQQETFAKGVFFDFFQCVNNNMMYEHKNTPIIEYPVEMFKSFDSVTVLTYMFEGATLKSFFEINGLKYRIKTLPTESNIGSKDLAEVLLNRSYLQDGVDYCGFKFNHLVEVEDDCKLNEIGLEKYSLSTTWHKKRAHHLGDRIGKNCRILFRTKCKSKSDECLYTTLKEFFEVVGVKGYTSAFVVMNIRATNKYADRKYGGYLINRFLNPIVKSFIHSKGSSIDEDMFALSEMLQWIWRLRIRNGESIKVYIPSERMRRLLSDWLAGKIGGDK